MKLRFSNFALFAAVLCLGLASCQKSADQQSSSGAASDAATEAAKKAASAATAKAIVVPAETAISVVLDQTLGSKTSSSGEAFAATVHSPIEVDGKVAIPKGAHAAGVVKEAKAAGRFKGGAVLSLTLTSVTIEGKDHEISTSSPTMARKGKGKRTAAMIGGGGAAGALIGGLAGGGKGAAIGAIVGAGAGTGGAAFTGNRDITLPVETVLTFKLLQPLEIKSK